MGWYDLFARFYDSSLEPLYRAQRAAAAEALALRGDEVVLDVPCGTGQSFDLIAPKLQRGGTLAGVDLSAGMLRQARERIARNGWTQVQLIESDVHRIGEEQLASVARGRRRVDRLHLFLGLTAFPRWREAFAHLWSLLEPGGRCVIVDVHDPKPGLQGHMVNLVARADIRRPFWEPLEQVAAGYSRTQLPSLPQHGGALYLATGLKPAAATAGS